MVVDHISRRGEEAFSADSIRIKVTREVMSGNYRTILIIFLMYSRLEHTGIFIRQYKLSKPTQTLQEKLHRQAVSP